jgi:hypothetical protein
MPEIITANKSKLNNFLANCNNRYCETQDIPKRIEIMGSIIEKYNKVKDNEKYFNNTIFDLPYMK